MERNERGEFYFKAVVPVPYPIPHGGPVRKLLQKLKRRPYRRSHFYFMFEKLSYDRLITVLYLRGNPYEKTDAVVGFKELLIIDFKSIANFEGLAEQHGILLSTTLPYQLVGRPKVAHIN
ncbi:hypothetical protein BU25DRAFT_478908 [Macroventuria anomochaeta]|uniref:Uncharacterized protein n=1 Tax=Macroventuria anomochaeta TaxID=301207 RepID=A0ACB6SBE3_9PLEO|nr:uncharacterized protein BU25DRAFT_478908 [Macroventuria anomochaeta]KAF2631384.1 hypothetical protein BU25DRAFT_478908 [Macroventuria anomochaeta]